MKRLFDIIASFIGLLILSPLLIILSIIIVIDSPGGVFFRGPRVGKNGKVFRIFKFRSMAKDCEGKGKWNVGDDDNRITRVGHFLRKTKLDELPQLINVLIGNMSLVGYRPELEYYVNMYTEEEKKILNTKPGITDYASIVNFDQFKTFTEALDPDEAYLKYIRPLKLKLQLYYSEHHSFFGDIRLLFWTVWKIISKTPKIPKEIQPIVDEHNRMISEEINSDMPQSA
ncbi:MAG: sugar transferase [Clostridiales bacterium]|nr:sugar transferase [Clostridiales bacterium]